VVNGPGPVGRYGHAMAMIGSKFGGSLHELDRSLKGKMPRFSSSLTPSAIPRRI